METLIVEEADDRVRVRLNRPDVRNAINPQMTAELNELCAELEDNPRILIISGITTAERGVFASGADIRSMLTRGRDEAMQGINARAFRRIAALPMPVIAAVDGYAIGGGAELAFAADLRIASTRAVFANPEAGLGILAAAGATWRLPALVGESVAKQMLFAGRRLNAQEALHHGLVLSLHEPDELAAAAEDLADQIAQNDPLAIRLTKRALAAPLEAHPLIDEVTQAVLFEAPAKTERMTAFVERSAQRRQDTGSTGSKEK